MAAQPTLCLYGCGTMAGAMLGRWLDTGVDAAHVTAIRRTAGPVAAGIVAHAAPPPTLAAPDILIIGIKPQGIADAAAAIATVAGPATRIVSIMAGVPLAALRTAFPLARSVSRWMPNLPVRSGAGIVATLGDEDASLDALLAPLGLVHPCHDEGEFTAVAALAGCGPAFVYRFIAALADAASTLGIDAGAAERLACAMVAGAGSSAAAAAQVPHFAGLAAMARAVASPGGMTEAGLAILDADATLETLVRRTLSAARDRGVDLAAAAAAVDATGSDRSAR